MEPKDGPRQKTLHFSFHIHDHLAFNGVSSAIKLTTTGNALSPDVFGLFSSAE
jgi:hypothetical protein